MGKNKTIFRVHLSLAQFCQVYIGTKWEHFDAIGCFIIATIFKGTS